MTATESEAQQYLPGEKPLDAVMTPINNVVASEDNLRSHLGDLTELVASIKAVGIYEPLVVEWDVDDEKYRTIAGHRRLAAAKEAGLTHIPVVVREMDHDEDRSVAMLIENLHREGLPPLDRARGFHRLNEAGWSQRKIADAVGINQSTVSKSMALLKLPEKAREWVADGKLTQEEGARLAALPKESVERVIGADARFGAASIGEEEARVELEKAHAKAVKLAKGKGWKVLDSKPGWWGTQQLDGSVEGVMVGHPGGGLAHVDAEEHAGLKCHAVWIDHGNTLVPACTAPDSHPAPKLDDEDVDDDAEDVTTEAGERAESDAARERREFLDRFENALLDLECGTLDVIAGEHTLDVIAGEHASLVLQRAVPLIVLDEDFYGTCQQAVDLLDVERLEVEATPGHLVHLDVDALSLAEYITDPAIDAECRAAKVLHALALTIGHRKVMELVLNRCDNQGPGVEMEALGDERTIETAADHFRYLRHFGGDDVPALGEFLGIGAAEAADEEEAVPEQSGRDDGTGPWEGDVIIRQAKGRKFVATCSQCGSLPPNTKVEYVRGAAAAHLLKEHGVTAEDIEEYPTYVTEQFPAEVAPLARS